MSRFLIVMTLLLWKLKSIYSNFSDTFWVTKNKSTKKPHFSTEVPHFVVHPLYRYTIIDLGCVREGREGALKRICPGRITNGRRRYIYHISPYHVKQLHFMTTLHLQYWLLSRTDRTRRLIRNLFYSFWFLKMQNNGNSKNWNYFNFRRFDYLVVFTKNTECCVTLQLYIQGKKPVDVNRVINRIWRIFLDWCE